MDGAERLLEPERDVIRAALKREMRRRMQKNLDGPEAVSRVISRNQKLQQLNWSVG